MPLTLPQLIAVDSALRAAADEIEACHAELRRLRDIEMIPIQHQPRTVAAALHGAQGVVTKAIEEAATS